MTAGRRAGQVGVETPSRVAAVRASRLLERGPEETFDRVAVLTATILSAPMAHLSIVDDAVTVLKGVSDAHALRGPDGAYALPARDTGCHVVVDEGTEIVVADTAADPRLRDLPHIRALGAAAWIGVPVVDPQGHVLGNLCGMDTRVRPWSEVELAGLRTLAAVVGDHIALCLAAHALEDHARSATELAQTLQQALLPARPPRVGGVAIATRYSPGGTGTEVLGDFYDVILTESGFGVVVGDVCGKGPAAARTTALARSAVRTVAHAEDDPVEVLGAVNDVLLEWFGEGRSFVTAVYARFVRGGDGWDVRLASAGHPPGFVRRADGHVVSLAGGGRVLGLTAEHPVALERASLGPGDALVLYTDGITEARDADGVQLDEGGVHAALENLDERPDAERIADVLVDTARAHAGGRHDDDVAVVVLQASTDGIPPARTVGGQPPPS